MPYLPSPICLSCVAPASLLCLPWRQPHGFVIAFFGAIRISGCQRSRMARQNRDTKAILKTIERSEQRSKLFWWMVEQHDEIIRKANGKRIDWPSVCAEAARRGKTDRLGNAPSVVTAKKTWQRARKDVDAARGAVAAQPQPPAHPSRIDKDWRPANAPPPVSASGQLAPGAQAVVPVAWSPTPEQQMLPVRTTPPHEKKPYDPKENLARLKRVINERSGR